MSFGYSIGDFIQLIQLARRSYRNCKEAGGEYLEIASVVRSLYSVLKTVREEAERSDSVLFNNDSKAISEVSVIADGCRGVLEDIESLLQKYHALGPDGPESSAPKRLWHRIRFGGELEELGKYRGKIITYTSMLAVHLDSVQIKATGRVENKVDEVLGRFEDMRKAVLEIATKARAAQRFGSVTSVDSLLSLSTYAEDDKAVWRRFRSELIARGFRSEALDRHMDVLKAYMMRLDQSGVLDHAVTGLGSSQQPWWTKNFFRLTNTSLPGISEVEFDSTLDSSEDQLIVPQPIHYRPKPILSNHANVGLSRDSSAVAREPNSNIMVSSSMSNRLTEATLSSERHRSPRREKPPPKNTLNVPGPIASPPMKPPRTTVELAVKGNTIQQSRTSRFAPKHPSGRPPPHRTMSDVLPPTQQDWSQPIIYTELSHHKIDPQSIHIHVNKSSVRNYQPPDLYDPFEFVPDQRSLSEDNILNCTLRSWLKSEIQNSDSNEHADIEPANDIQNLHLDSREAEGISDTNLDAGRTSNFGKMIESRAPGTRPPSPYAETYNSDIESISSHSTLIRPIEDLKSSRSKTWAYMPRPSRLPSPPNSVSSGSTVRAGNRNTRGVDGGKVSGPVGESDIDLKGDKEPDLITSKLNRTKSWAESLPAEPSATIPANAKSTSSRIHSPTRPDSDRDAESVAQQSITGSLRSDGTPKYQSLARKALFAGASEAFKVSSEEGSWRADNGKRAITAALDASGIENEQTRKMVEDIFTGLFKAPTADDDEECAYNDEESIPRSVSGSSGERRTANRSKRYRMTSPASESRYSDSDDSSVGNSSDDEKRVKRAKGKELLGAGLALVSTLNAATNIYEMFEKRGARQRAVQEGEMSPEEVRKLKAKATLQNAASVGISALGIKEVISRWKNANENRKETAEMAEKAAMRAVRRK